MARENRPDLVRMGIDDLVDPVAFLRGCLITDLQPGRLQRMARGKSAQ